MAFDLFAQLPKRPGRFADLLQGALKFMPEPRVGLQGLLKCVEGLLGLFHGRGRGKTWRGSCSSRPAAGGC